MDMKKKIFMLLLVFCCIFAMTGCDKKMTLNLAYGEREGTYSGEVNSEGLPDGNGKFTTKNADGGEWTYEGEFKNGHFEGEGTTTWKDGGVETGTYKDDVIVPMKDDEIKELYSSPESFKNHYVDITGVVFSSPEVDDDGIYLQLMTDIKNYSNNTIVYINDKDFKVKENDYLHIVGKVGDVFSGKNALGGDVTAPTIIAKEYEILNYQDALAPALKTVEVNQTQTQSGYSVTLQKVEYAEIETRVYLKVDNKGSDKFSVYDFNAKISQNGKQYEPQDNWEADYPQIQTDLLVGNSTEGIITFPVLEKGKFELIIEGSSDNFEEEINPYLFTVE